ncbi:hypothetical protein [Streptomyces mexicanus]|uniref:hypothetical protein n=1 Tax=Streptomyces mexicanus TaxID=178566 RepID=UPI0031ED62E6
MTDDGTEPEVTGGVVRQPLPPEVPAPRPAAPDADAHAATSDADTAEWWRKPPPADPEASQPRAEGAAGPGPAVPDASTGEPQGEGGWWNGESLRGELRDAWSDHGMEAVAAAHEIGAHIGGAIAAHLPDPHAAAAKRGLDIRWMRLKINLPAIALSTLVTWGGRSPFDRMVHTVTTDGILAPVGFVMMFGILIGVLMLMPVGSALATGISHLVNFLIGGLITLVRRGWSLPVTGYLLRLVVATAAWSFAIALLYVLGRGAIKFLTGV